MDTVAGLDIGSSHVVVAVAVPPSPAAREWKNTRESGDARSSLAAGAAKDYKVEFSGTLGLRRGRVSDPAALSASIRDALSRAETAAGAKVGTVCLGLPGHTVEFYRKKYSSLIGKRRINQQDIERISRLAMVSDLPPGRRIIQAIPVEYAADGVPADGIPLGMYCSRLEAEFVIIAADSILVDQLVETVHGTGVKVVDVVPSTLAAGGVLLDQAQQRLGAVLVDIGVSCTGILIYNHGYPVAFDVIQVGGGHITSDLAICLRTTLEGAEEVKINVGLGPKRAEGEDGRQGGPGVVTIPRLSGSGFNRVPLKKAVSVIEARICEILELAGSSVSRLTGGLGLPGGMVLAGGGGRLKGLDLFAAEYLGVKVRQGAPGIEDENSRIAANTAGAVGLLRQVKKFFYPAEAEQLPPADLLSRVRAIFKVSR
ncbi:MAG: cell division protein FtsA [Peptococcaceae bacterium]|nr:cell division protein FtsA [Peptococcaceae bacterium]